MSVLPGLAPKTPVKCAEPSRLVRDRITAAERGLLGIAEDRAQEAVCTFGRHATPTLGATLFQSVL